MLPSESVESYAHKWDGERGYHLTYHSQDFMAKVAAKVGEKYDVCIGMQYCEPDAFTVMKGIRARGVDRGILVPMYPQFMSSATDAAIEIFWKAAAEVY